MAEDRNAERKAEIRRRIKELMTDMEAAGYKAVIAFWEPPSNGSGQWTAVLDGLPSMDAQEVERTIILAAMAADDELGQLIRQFLSERGFGA